MSNIDVLLVEDDRRLAELTRDYLIENGFTVAIEGRGDMAVARFKSTQPNMVLLDISLPGKNGLDICRDLRAEFSGPILMLTARDTNIEQIIGLEAGADDYITKPADPMVLVARMRAALRRQQASVSKTPAQKDNILIGSLEVSDSSRYVKLSGQEIAMTSLEFDLLRTLAEHAGAIVDRDKLSIEARGVPYDGLDRTVDARISRLRKKLGDNPDEPKRIRTVWGKGYLLVPDAWD